MKLTKLELAVMDVLWTCGPSSIREVHDAWSRLRRPAYTTVQTIVYRLEAKKAVRRAKKVGNAHVFEAVLPQHVAQGTLIDELLHAFGGRSQPLVSYLIDTGRLTTDDLKDARKRLAELVRKEKAE